MSQAASDVARSIRPRAYVGRGVGAIVLLVATTCWVGATSAQASWFGAVTAHGSRRHGDVALTFDGDPASPDTAAVLRTLDRRGVRATFFPTAGELLRRPAASAALLADGQLVGAQADGSLRLRYAALSRSTAAFADTIGVCPTYFRPAHGRHNPLLAHAVHRLAMRMVTWDVTPSPGDDVRDVARDLLARVRPGSIVVFQLQPAGRATAASSRTLGAELGSLLTGLRDHGLHPVRLDTMLHDEPYGGRCRSATTAG